MSPARASRTRLIERQSLQIGVLASALMALAGVWVHLLSGSTALLLDGLYSAVMVGSGLVAAKISCNVVRPPDRAYPYGYDGQEALYVLFRSLVLVGVLSFAAISALSTIIDYANGEAISPVSLGPVALYAGAMVVICWGLAWRHHHDWQRTGSQSQLLLTEAKAARVDGLISGLTGLALLASPLLSGTALGQAAGASAEGEMIHNTRLALTDLLAGLSCWLLDLTVMQVGRTAFVVV